MGKRKKDNTFLRKKEEKQKSATIMISADVKETVFPVKGFVWIKISKKRVLEKTWWI